MPRTTIDVASNLDHLTILDADGSVDRELEPDLPEAALVRMYRTMLLSRKFDDRMLSLQRQGRLGTFAPAQGQEASQVGAAAVLRDSDWVVPSYRETAVALWRGQSLAAMLVHNAGYAEGGALDEGSRDLPAAVPVGTQMLHASGLAYALRVQQREEIVMTFFGDGATSQGDFHEAMNFAMVFRCPVVFLCQNNQYAISVPRSRQTKSETLAQKAFGYGMPCLQVDGNDVLAVHVAAMEAAQRAREERTPTMIECVTYRLAVHTTVDDPTKYREESEVQKWRKRDPIPRFQRYLEDAGLLADGDVEAMEAEIESGIDEAVEAAENSSKESTADAIFGHLFERPPAFLERQRQACEGKWGDAQHG